MLPRLHGRASAPTDGFERVAARAERPVNPLQLGRRTTAPTGSGRSGVLSLARNRPSCNRLWVT
jgi:hypothetical protein